MRQEPKPLELYRHFKGNVYQIKCIATHSETQEKLVIYQAMYGTFEMYARPLAMFLEEVDHTKYPDVTQKYRFERLEAGAPVTEAVMPKTAGTVPEKNGAEPVGAECEKMAAQESIAEPGTEDSMPAKTAETESADEEFYVDPQVFDFLDAKTAEKRLELLAKLHHKLDDNMIDIMAAGLDMEIKKGDIEQRYEELKHCLLVIDRFECTRLRG